jgi:hypothetical protein
MQTLAHNFKKLMDDFAADGIDFDLENLGVTDVTAYANSIVTFINLLQGICNGKAIISIAPQVNLVNNKCELVNTGEQQIYYHFMNLVNYVFF